ncbi:MAG: helix-turn-helix domain-containing protein [Pyrinomonadaceae bacterium]
MKTLNSIKSSESRDAQVIRQCLQAQELERAGDYEAARRALSGVWTAIGERPITKSLQSPAAAEVLLRAGTLSGWIGSTRQISGSQEFAKDLIGESARMFEELGDQEKLAEAQTDLAICYWREGALEEARVLFQQAAENARFPENKLRVLVNAITVDIGSGDYQRSLFILDEAAPLLEQTGNNGLKGRYHSHRAVTLRNLGVTDADYLDRALVEYSAASFHFQIAGHSRYVATVENNIGFLLLQLRRYAEALGHLDRALKIFVALKDAGMVAQVNETNAQVFLAQHSYIEAERWATAAVRALENGDQLSLLAGALITQGIALSRLGEPRAARASFERAIAASDTSGDKRSSARAYLVMIEELKTSFPGGEAAKLYLEADQRVGKNPDKDMLERLRRCAIIALDNSTDTVGSLTETGSVTNLEQQLLQYEAQLIKKALDEAQGSITRAARILGLTHQGLAYIISTRHEKLMWMRRPVRTRRRSIMRKL